MAPVSEPFPISHIAGRYLLFDVDVVGHARREQNICGVLIGTIPHMSQQNVFLGLPLELMPEEARVLVEKGHAYLVDEVEAHRQGFVEMSREDRLAYLHAMDQIGLEKSMAIQKKKEQRAEQAIRQKGLVPVLHESSLDNKSKTVETSSNLGHIYFHLDGNAALPKSELDDDTSLFGPRPAGPALVAMPEMKLEPSFITPTTSYPPLPRPAPHSMLPLPAVAKNYPLFRYLHSKGYFSMPGLRFGCHYSVYPGDPLRFHSHFLATGMGWDDEFELLDIVGGGRLGTGVKKAYLIGGEDPNVEREGKKDGSVDLDPVRAFSIEWAGL